MSTESINKILDVCKEVNTILDDRASLQSATDGIVQFKHSEFQQANYILVGDTTTLPLVV